MKYTVEYKTPGVFSVTVLGEEVPHEELNVDLDNNSFTFEVGIDFRDKYIETRDYPTDFPEFQYSRYLNDESIERLLLHYNRYFARSSYFDLRCDNLRGTDRVLDSKGKCATACLSRSSNPKIHEKYKCLNLSRVSSCNVPISACNIPLSTYNFGSNLKHLTISDGKIPDKVNIKSEFGLFNDCKVNLDSLSIYCSLLSINFNQIPKGLKVLNVVNNSLNDQQIRAINFLKPKTLVVDNIMIKESDRLTAKYKKLAEITNKLIRNTSPFDVETNITLRGTIDRQYLLSDGKDKLECQSIIWKTNLAYLNRVNCSTIKFLYLQFTEGIRSE